jgi:tetratricopeptide (TPR) repeat protein
VEWKDTQAAIETYKKVLALDPNDVDTLTIVGNLHLCEHLWDEAEEYYRQVLDLEPWRFEIQDYIEKLVGRKESPERNAESRVMQLYRSSQELVEAGDVAGAISQLEEVIDADPEYALAYNDLGVLSYQTGRKEKAVEYYRMATQLMPDNHIFLKNMADFYCFDQGNLKEALPLYSKILNEEPTDIEVLLAMGRINQHLDRKDDAKLFFNRVLDLEPWNADAAESLERMNTREPFIH